MERYKYKAINANGRPVRGVVSASSEADLYNQLQTAGMELVSCALIDQAKVSSRAIFARKVKVHDLIQFFVQMNQLQGAGVQMLEALSDIRASSESDAMRDVVSDVARDVSEGSSLSAAMGKHPKVFGVLVCSLVAAGEQTGDILAIYRQLITYLTWVDEMQRKVKKATRYPIIVSVVVMLMLVVMLGVVVPQIIGFIQNLGQDIPFYTRALISTSEFFQDSWFYVLVVPVLAYVFIRYGRLVSNDLAYRIDLLMMNMPLAGEIIRKSAVARYTQTFGVLYSSGIDVVTALRSASQTVSNRALLEALDVVEAQVRAGRTLSQSFESCGEFPSLVVRMLRVGEESGDLKPVLDMVSDFYTKEVNESVEGLTAIIEPMLTLVMGVVILWIGLSVFGPVYESFSNMDF